MMNDKLIDLVPSLESCLKIPSGQFIDTALVWRDESEDMCFWDGADKDGNHIGGVRQMKLPAHVRPRKHYQNTVTGLHPAPTVRETLFDLLDKGYRNIYLNCCSFPSTCTCVDPDGNKISRGGNTPEEAAISLWLYCWLRNSCTNKGNENDEGKI